MNKSSPFRRTGVLNKRMTMEKLTEEMLKKGYIVVPKALLESFLATNGKAKGHFEALMLVLTRVNYSDTECVSQNCRFVCRRGESVHSILHWAEMLGWSRSATRHFFNAMFRTGILERVSNQAGITQIRVTDYDLWTCYRKTYERGKSRTDETFREFWEEYHELTRMEKVNIGRARREWQKLTEQERKLAQTSIGEYYAHLRNVDFCKQAAMYLADKAFLNEYYY